MNRAKVADRRAQLEELGISMTDQGTKQVGWMARGLRMARALGHKTPEAQRRLVEAALVVYEAEHRLKLR